MIKLIVFITLPIIFIGHPLAWTPLFLLMVSGAYE
tara:strand:+ start:405 stop:509 length:105 start_codon:yes stop_codon:yes gene_type:complete